MCIAASPFFNVSAILNSNIISKQATKSQHGIYILALSQNSPSSETKNNNIAYFIKINEM